MVRECVASGTSISSVLTTTSRALVTKMVAMIVWKMQSGIKAINGVVLDTTHNSHCGFQAYDIYIYMYLIDANSFDRLCTSSLRYSEIYSLI